MLIELTGVEPLSTADAQAEIKAKIAEGPIEGLENVGGYPIYEISDACAMTIASWFPGKAMDWLESGVPVGPEYIQHDIDDLLAIPDLTEIDALVETDEWGREVLGVLRGWAYYKVYKVPHEPMPRVPVEEQLKLSSVSVRDLLGRYVANKFGAEFKITDIRYNFEWGRVTFELSDLDDNGQVIPDSESGVFGLEGFRVL